MEERNIQDRPDFFSSLAVDDPDPDSRYIDVPEDIELSQGKILMMAVVAVEVSNIDELDHNYGVTEKWDKLEFDDGFMEQEIDKDELKMYLPSRRREFFNETDLFQALYHMFESDGDNL